MRSLLKSDLQEEPAMQCLPLNSAGAPTLGHTSGIIAYCAAA